MLLFDIHAMSVVEITKIGIIIITMKEYSMRMKLVYFNKEISFYFGVGKYEKKITE